jgi:hypothetical protein
MTTLLPAATNNNKNRIQRQSLMWNNSNVSARQRQQHQHQQTKA